MEHWHTSTTVDTIRLWRKRATKECLGKRFGKRNVDIGMPVAKGRGFAGYG